MNREIKFRVWDKYDNKWIIDNKHLESIFRLFFIPNEVKTGKDHYILQQFTNVTDKNGKEVYEGDIIRGNIPADLWGETHKDVYRAIIWEPKWFTFCADGGLHGLLGGNNLDSVKKYGEVVGNIFENPKLLTATQTN